MAAITWFMFLVVAAVGARENWEKLTDYFQHVSIWDWRSWFTPAIATVALRNEIVDGAMQIEKAVDFCKDHASPAASAIADHVAHIGEMYIPDGAVAMYMPARTEEEREARAYYLIPRRYRYMA